MPALLAIPLLVLLTAFVAYGSAALQHSSSTGFVNWLARTIGNIPIISGILSVDNILKLDRWVLNLVGKHFQQVERAAVGWVVSLDHAVRRNAKAALALAAPVWGLAYWLVHVEIRRQAQQQDKPIAKTANQALAVATDARNRAIGHKTTPVIQTNTKTVTKVEKVTLPHAEEWDWITHHWGGLVKAISLAGAGAIAHPYPGSIPIAWPRGWTPTAIRKRFRRVEALLGVTAFAALMAKVLGVTPRCLGRTGNVGKTARRLCGLPTHFLNDLLALATDFLVLTDICQVVRWLNDGLAVVETPLRDFVTGTDAIVCYGDKATLGSLGTFPYDPIPLQVDVALEA